MKKFGVISEYCKEREDVGQRARALFEGHLGGDYDISFFPLESLGEQDLDFFDAMYLSSLGKVKGREAQILDKIRMLRRARGLVINDPRTMEDNFDKRYLLFLQEMGIPVIPTREVSGMSFDELSQVSFDGSSETILKPRYFSERSGGLVKLAELPSREQWEAYQGNSGQLVLAQPFLSTIGETGERSVVFVGDTYSHCVHRARKGEWSGGPGFHFTRMDATGEELGIVGRVLDAWPTRYHVSRFDFIDDGDGNPLISEVEMINPSLYLKVDGIDTRFMPLLRKHVAANLVS